MENKMGDTIWGYAYTAALLNSFFFALDKVSFYLNDTYLGPLNPGFLALSLTWYELAQAIFSGPDSRLDTMIQMARS